MDVRSTNTTNAYDASAHYVILLVENQDTSHTECAVQLASQQRVHALWLLPPELIEQHLEGSNPISIPKGQAIQPTLANLLGEDGIIARGAEGSYEGAQVLGRP